LANIDGWKEAIEARKEYCQVVRPVGTIMAIDRFVNPEWVIEIKAVAYVADVDIEVIANTLFLGDG